MTRTSGGLSRWQEVVVQAVLPILFIGIVLPLGLTALVLGLDQIPLSKAVDHGELYLVGGNAAFTSCLVLISNRPDQAINTFIVSAVINFTVVFPCYLAWVLLATSTARETHYSTDVTIDWGFVAAIAGLLTAVVLVTYAFFIPAGARMKAPASRSATLGK